MAEPVPQSILSWLQNVLSDNYHDFNRSYSDVANALHQYPSLRLKNDVYTSEQGTSTLLVNVHGVLPVTFKGTTYGFPISLWIPQEYPWSAPVALVTPAQDMVIRPGQYVSAEGRVYHPYLANWRNDRSSIAELLYILQDIFSKVPPVVAKQTQNQSQPYQPQRNYANSNPPQLPPKRDSSTQQPSSASESRPPPLPPKSNTSAESKYDRPAPLPPEAQPSRRASDLQAFSTANNHYVNPESTAGLAQKDMTYNRPPASGWQQYQAQNGPFSPKQAASQQQQYHPAHAQSYYAPPSNEQHHQGQIPGQIPSHPAQSNYTGQNVTQAPPSTAVSHPQGPGFAHQQPFQSSQPKKKPQEDLLTSPFDTIMPAMPTQVAPPPIPPNPEKDALLSAISRTLTQQIQSTYSSNLAAIPPLRAQQSALKSTLGAINHETAQLKELEAMLSSNEQILRKAMRDADQVLEDAKKRKVPDVDEVLVAPTVVAGQLYQTVAEERAIEDCRNVLGKALDKGRISSTVWAKQSRSLAREEFLKKALIKKISKGMGLVDERDWQ